MAGPVYIQINKNAQPEKAKLMNARSKLSAEDEKALKQAEKDLAESAKAATGKKMTGLGKLGFMELLCKLELFRKSLETDHPHRGALARMDVVTSALEGSDDWGDII